MPPPLDVRTLVFCRATACGNTFTVLGSIIKLHGFERPHPVVTHLLAARHLELVERIINHPFDERDSEPVRAY